MKWSDITDVVIDVIRSFYTGNITITSYVLFYLLPLKKTMQWMFLYQNRCSYIKMDVPISKFIFYILLTKIIAA